MELFGNLLRGHTDAIILSLLEQGDSYGYEINSTISRISGNKINLTEATLYTAFRRLENEGHIVSYWKEGLNQTKRRYYSITEKGKEYLAKKKKEWASLKRILNNFLGK